MQKHRNHKVVIVGGGAGGLELASRLGRRFGSRHVTLIDKNLFHIWKPSLHEVAAGTLDIHKEGLSYAMLAKHCGFTFVPGEVRGVDRDAQTVELGPLTSEQGEEFVPRRGVQYDSLVIAVGSRSNFFGTPGASEHAFALDSMTEAERFRLKLLRALHLVNVAKQVGSGRQLNIVIVGGGATGVELAAELREACANIALYGLTGLEPQRDVRITLMEGAPRILAPLPEKLSKAAHGLLSARGIDIMTNVRVASVDANGLKDSSGNFYPADICVWAAGIEAPAFLKNFGLATNRLNQLIVDEFLCTDDRHVFALGDCAQAPWAARSKSVPARAQAAHQQASYLFKVMTGRILQRSTSSRRPFDYHDRGSLVSVGQAEGVGSLMGVLTGKSLFVKGQLARLMYMSLHLMHHQAVIGTLPTMLAALGRLLLKRTAPRVKLH
ncbi:NADH dehydrogenase [Caballeronia choica]|uniref:NADH dehydrogenase n=1 Tax=Caballeronia choica TaxID=326476 RepID=A0A158JPT6_9BURK|nr:NAD(P)/FAD-dependent oxidoreductase [Caballeronia choica]SAL70360.1 NADH dehydrogenase [Caballeronia choica]